MQSAALPAMYALLGLAVRWAGLGELEGALQHFGAWYNQVRPHQHLGGRMPAEAR